MKASPIDFGSNQRVEGKRKDGTAYKVLVVDDSMFTRKQLGKILTSEGFELLDQAANGAEAIDKYKQLYPNIDLVTMDITMPHIDGITALEKIIEFDKDAKVIMISALGKEELVQKALLIGAKSYIIKPLERNKVLERIIKILS